MSQAAIEFEDLQLDEEWRDIPNYPGYQASNLGRIKSAALKKFNPTFGVDDAYGYMKCHIMYKNKCIQMSVHRLVLLAFIGQPKINQECDHINRNRSDNRIENLRWVSRHINALNKDSYGVSKYKGVCFKKYKLKDGTFVNYIVGEIKLHKKYLYLGVFKTEEEAHEEYKKAFKNYHGFEYISEFHTNQGTALKTRNNTRQ